MKIAICCETSFQLLNALNLIYTIDEEISAVDLYCRNQKQEIIESLKEQKIFSNIYEYDYPKKKIEVAYFNYLMNLTFFPKRFIQTVVKENLLIRKSQYDCIAITAASPLSVHLVDFVKPSRVIAYDDGASSYVGDILHEKSMSTVRKLLDKRVRKIHPDTLYVNNIGICKSTMCGTIKQLTPWAQMSEKYQSKIKNVFHYTENILYDERRIVYLTQVERELGIPSFSQSEIVVNCLSEYLNDVLIRKHPRDTNTVVNDAKYDDVAALWELSCASTVTEEHVLIGICSTAQITPKIMFDKEPWVVFTYRLFQIPNERFENVCEQLVKSIKDQYVNKNKILVPATQEELRAMVEKIQSGQ